MTPEQELQEAKKIFEIADEKANEARRNLRAVEAQVGIPVTNHLYAGKFFKYQNAYDTHHKWWIYIQVFKAVATNKVLVNKFETVDDISDNPEYRFVFQGIIYTNELKEEIDEFDYKEALALFTEKINCLKEI